MSLRFTGSSPVLLAEKFEAQTLVRQKFSSLRSDRCQGRRIARTQFRTAIVKHWPKCCLVVAPRTALAHAFGRRKLHLGRQDDGSDDVHLLDAWNEVEGMEGRRGQASEAAYLKLAKSYASRDLYDLALSTILRMGLKGLPVRADHVHMVMDIYAEKGMHREALQLLLDMPQLGHRPDVVSYTILMKAQIRRQLYYMALATFDQMRADGVGPDPKARQMARSARRYIAETRDRRARRDARSAPSQGLLTATSPPSTAPPQRGGLPPRPSPLAIATSAPSPTPPQRGGLPPRPPSLQGLPNATSAPSTAPPQRGGLPPRPSSLLQGPPIATSAPSTGPPQRGDLPPRP